jgi:type I restriction enzyme S subunit
MTVRVASLADLDRWDVKHLLARPWLWPPSELRPFGSLAKQRKQPHDGSLRYGSLHFDGTISLRDEETEIGGSSWVARPGDLVFSKIDARNGAIGLVPEEYGDIAFTNEFPIYELEPTAGLRQDYAKLLLRTQTFLSQVDASAVGHSGRKRVPPEVFEALVVPVPPPAEQQAVAEQFHSAMARAAARKDAATPLVKAAAAELLRDLGVDYVRLRRPPFAFSVPSHSIPRWSVRKAAEVAQGVTGEITAAYDVARVGKHAELRRGISKNPENRPDKYATPYVRVANVQPGFVDLADVQELEVPPEQLPRARLAAGDVLVCRNNSLEWVGKAAPWGGEIDPCVHDDHVFSVRCGSSLVPSFLNAYLQTDFARAWFISEAQITTNLAGIAGEAVTALPIPLPSPPLQDELGRRFEGTRLEARQLFAQGVAEEQAARSLAEWTIVASPDQRRGTRGKND